MGGLEDLAAAAGEAWELVRGPALGALGSWLLALVFVWSGLVKLRRPTRAALALVDFGIVSRPTRSAGVALGAFELALALALAAAALAGGVLRLAAAVAALGTLAAFTALIAAGLRRGERFACYCFGDADEELSPATLARTAALATIATVLLIGAVEGWNAGDAHAPTVEEAVLGGVAALSLVAAAGLWRRVGSARAALAATLQPSGPVITGAQEVEA